MSDLLSIGASGVRAYQTALGTVSDNIANAGTAGYARRVATMRELTPAGAMGLTTTIARPGNGVIVGSIDRQADAYKATAVRTAAADLARTEAGTTWLSRVQSVLADGAAGTGMTGFFAAMQRLAADPTSAAARASVLAAAGTVADAFRSTARGLDTAAADLDSVTTDATGQLSQFAAGLAKVNEGLGRAVPGTSGAANLLDQRDLLLERMSALTDVAVSLDGAGRATVRLGTQGPALVAGTSAAAVSADRNADGSIAFVTDGVDGARSFTPTGGVLAGFAEGAQRIADARGRLEAIAETFAETVNTQMEAGDDAAGQPGTKLFTVGDPATQLTLAYDDPALIAAAARGGGPRDGTNLLRLQAQRTASGVEDASTALTAGVAAAIEGRGLVADAQTAIRDSAVSARDAVSGVDLDREAVDLLRFQQAYQASSRVIQVARETFQSILAIN